MIIEHNGKLYEEIEEAVSINGVACRELCEEDIESLVSEKEEEKELKLSEIEGLDANIEKLKAYLPADEDEDEEGEEQVDAPEQ